MDSKLCRTCGNTYPLSEWIKRKDGRPISCCRACNRERIARYHRESKGALAYRSDPLNLALRDMPGSRVSLLGIAGVRITEELRAA